MYTRIDEEGNTVEVYHNEFEYANRGYELMRTGGRRQYIYEGWMNGELVRILRRY